MIQPILPSPYIQGVAVGEEGLATPLFHEICHRLGPVGPQEGQIARFTKVHFDGHELPVEVDFAHPGSFHEAGQLLLEILLFLLLFATSARDLLDSIKFTVCNSCR